MCREQAVLVRSREFDGWTPALMGHPFKFHKRRDQNFPFFGGILPHGGDVSDCAILRARMCEDMRFRACEEIERLFVRRACFQRSYSILSGALSLSALFALLGFVALVSGCAAVVPFASMLGSPNVSALQIQNNTEVRLQQKDFIVVKTNVVGQCKGFSLFGVVTIVPAAVTTAMNRLYTQAAMQPGRSQTLANLIMEKDSTFLLLFSIPRTSVRADVIEFTPPAAAEIQPQPPPQRTRFQ